MPNPTTRPLDLRPDGSVQLEDEFYCRPRRKRLTIDDCLEDYMDANAYEKQRSACYRCPLGRNVRRAFAES